MGHLTDTANPRIKIGVCESTNRSILKTMGGMDVSGFRFTTGEVLDDDVIVTQKEGEARSILSFRANDKLAIQLTTDNDNRQSRTL